MVHVDRPCRSRRSVTLWSATWANIFDEEQDQKVLFRKDQIFTFIQIINTAKTSCNDSVFRFFVQSTDSFNDVHRKQVLSLSVVSAVCLYILLCPFLSSSYGRSADKHNDRNRHKLSVFVGNPEILVRNWTLIGHSIVPWASAASSVSNLPSSLLQIIATADA